MKLQPLSRSRASLARPPGPAWLNLQSQYDLWHASILKIELPARFLVLGSASPDLLRQSSETLAGRILYHRLGGLELDEVGLGERDRLWLRGGFPRSFLAASDPASAEWRREFVHYRPIKPETTSLRLNDGRGSAGGAEARLA